MLTAKILAANASSTVKSRLISYGARSTSPGKFRKGQETAQQQPRSQDQQKLQANGDSNQRPESQHDAAIEALLDKVSTITVPHHYFTHFYVLSLILSLFWAQQFLSQGYLFRLLASHTTTKKPAMTINQVYLLWQLMVLQASRRLYECLTLTKPSTSRMWIGHYAIGLAFYAAMSVAVWVEGPLTLESAWYSTDAAFSFPSARLILTLPLFLIASAAQYLSHGHLASLRKYSMPTHPLFKLLVCPHYTAECVIYLALAILGAPEGRWINGTIAAALVFVSVNLGVTAKGTGAWYERRFGEQAVRGKWVLVPGIW